MSRAALICFAVVSACSPSSPGTIDVDGPPPGAEPEPARGEWTAPDASTASAGPDAGGPAPGRPDGGAVEVARDDCQLGLSSCLAYNRRRACVATAQGTRWSEETCAAGSGCVSGACVAARCSDECTLGETVGGKRCELFDVASGKWTQPDPAASLHDRARAYAAWIRRYGLTFGGIGSARFSDPPAYTQVEYMDGIGDSAIWTGTLLAAEALRLEATGAPDARANVVRLVETLHLWLNVSGSPGNLARFAAPSGAPVPYVVGDLNCAHDRVHCGVSYQGRSYDYVGHVSRDQYQGVMLGYALAFDALADEDAATKQRIREDVVTLVKELMTERKVPLQLTFNGVAMPKSTVNARFIVLNPAEMKNGALDLRVSTSSAGDSDMYGFQEFAPDLAMLIRQIPGLGWVPSYYRPSSAIMLASFFQVALRVTDRPEDQADHAAILAYYTGHTGEGGNVSDWLTIARKWSDGGGCGGNYYANNITMEPLYNLARLESDAGRHTAVVSDVLGAKLWPAFVNTKNPFFSFIYAGVSPGAGGQVTGAAAAQLSQFPPPPRVHAPVDLRSDPRYAQREPSCTDQVAHSTAVDVGDRVSADFLWQRHPWALYDAGDLRRTDPGVDYLAAYWLGRRHGFIADDGGSRCNALRP